MFNLDQAIAQWRKQMLDAGLSSSDILDELETHLRDDMERQIKLGTDAQWAFGIAAENLGRSDALKNEFKKGLSCSRAMGERTWKLVWMGVGATAYAAPIALNGPHLLSQLNLTERWLAVAAFALTIVSLFSGFVIYRFLPVIPEKQTRTRFQMAIFLLVFIWLCVFAFVVLPHAEFTFGRLLVITLWALCPLGLFGSVVFGLDEAARRRTSAPGA